jgi:hypothetical protein
MSDTALCAVDGRDETRTQMARINVTLQHERLI